MLTGGGGRVILLYDFQTSCNKIYLYLSGVISEIFPDDKCLITKYLYIDDKGYVKNFSGILIYGIEHTNDQRMWWDLIVKKWTRIGLGGRKQDITEEDGI